MIQTSRLDKLRVFKVSFIPPVQGLNLVSKKCWRAFFHQRKVWFSTASCKPAMVPKDWPVLGGRNLKNNGTKGLCIFFYSFLGQKFEIDLKYFWAKLKSHWFPENCGAFQFSQPNQHPRCLAGKKAFFDSPNIYLLKHLKPQELFGCLWKKTPIRTQATNWDRTSGLHSDLKKRYSWIFWLCCRRGFQQA